MRIIVATTRAAGAVHQARLLAALREPATEFCLVLGRSAKATRAKVALHSPARIHLQRFITPRRSDRTTQREDTQLSPIRQSAAPDPFGLADPRQISADCCCGGET